MDLVAQVRRVLERGPLVAYHRAQRLAPVDRNLAVYSSFWGRGFTCNPRAIYDKARELAPHIKGVWIAAPDAVDRFPTDVDVVVEGTRECARVLARAGFLVNNVNFAGYYRKRNGTQFVQTHHGTPLKAMGIEIKHSSDRERRQLLRRCRAWDFSITSNAHSTEVFERAYPVPYETLEYGYPRNDRLAVADPNDVEQQRRALGLAPDETAVLYAPTFRDTGTTDAYLDPHALAGALGPGHRVLVRAHHFVDRDSLGSARSSDHVLDVSGHPLIEDLFIAADVLITDYSSISFDFAVLDRPVVIHAPDWDDYRATRGATFDLMEAAPGFVSRTVDELVEGFRSGAVAGPEATARRQAFRERFCSLDDGRAAERVVRRVMLGEPADTVAP